MTSRHSFRLHARDDPADRLRHACTAQPLTAHAKTASLRVVRAGSQPTSARSSYTRARTKRASMCSVMRALFSVDAARVDASRVHTAAAAGPRHRPEGSAPTAARRHLASSVPPSPSDSARAVVRAARRAGGVTLSASVHNGVSGLTCLTRASRSPPPPPRCGMQMRRCSPCTARRVPPQPARRSLLRHSRKCFRERRRRHCSHRGRLRLWRSCPMTLAWRACSMTTSGRRPRTTSFPFSRSPPAAWPLLRARPP